MRSPISFFLAAVLIGTVLSSCSGGQSESAQDVLSQGMSAAPPSTERIPGPGVRTGTVKETMNASGYTYVNVDTGNESFWAAAPSFTVKVGDAVSVPAGMPMQDFHSSALDRDFDIVFFVDGVQVGSGSPAEDRLTRTPAPSSLPAGHPPVVAPRADLKAGDIEKLKGGRTVGEIIADSGELEGVAVSFRGKVVKFNANILGSNWLHVQDGTGSPGTNDLTVTTTDVARVGDIVSVSGVLAADKDFGAGYAYDLIVQDAKVTVE